MECDMLSRDIMSHSIRTPFCLDSPSQKSIKFRGEVMKKPYLMVATLALIVSTGAIAEDTTTEQTLEEMNISGTAIGSDYVAPTATSGTKTDTPIMETPLNIQVVPRQVLQDQKATTLDQALTNVSGVISNSFAQGQETIHLRGFQVSTTFLNGFRIEDNSTGLRTLTNVDSIEVLKGPAAILYGAIEPGGMVNINTRQPQATPAYSIEQSVGSWDHFLTNLNATGPLTKDNSLLYQVNLSYDTQNSWIDGVYDRKLFFAPTLQLNISPETQAAVEFEYTHNPFIFDNVQALPYVNGHFIHTPRSTNLGVTMPYTVDTYFGQLRLSHEFNDDWSAKFQVGENKGRATGIAPSLASVVPSGNSYIASSYLNLTSAGIIDTLGTSLDITGHFDVAGIKNKLLLGADYYHTSSPTSGAGSQVTYSIDLLNPVYPGSPPPGLYPLDPSYGTFAIASIAVDKGIYVQDQIELPHNLFATAGFRYDRIDLSGSFSFNSPGFSFSSVSQPLSESAVTPRLGVLWKAQNWLSLYGNYAGSLSANPNSIDFMGNIVPSSHARQYEAGIKAESQNGDLRATLAYYNLTKTNVPTTDPIHPGASVSVGELGSKGVELDIQGNILPNLKVIATYAHMNVTVLQSNDVTCASTGSFCVGDRFANVPTQMASLWTTYEFKQDALDGLKIGAGITAQNESTNQNNTVNYPGFAVLNAMASYTTKTNLGRVTTQLNVNNILDKYYFTGNFSSGGATTFATVNFGAPINAIASLRLEF